MFSPIWLAAVLKPTPRVVASPVAWPTYAFRWGTRQSAWAVAIYCRLVTVTFLWALAEPDCFPNLT